MGVGVGMGVWLAENSSKLEVGRRGPGHNGRG